MSSCHCTATSCRSWLVFCLMSHKAERRVSSCFCPLSEVLGKNLFSSWFRSSTKFSSLWVQDSLFPSVHQLGGQSVLLDAALLPSRAARGAALQQREFKSLLNLKSLWLPLWSLTRKIAVFSRSSNYIWSTHIIIDNFPILCWIN